MDQERIFQALIEAVQDYAIYMLDPQGRVMTWNVGAERAKGYSTDEIIGQHFSRFFLPEDIADGKPDIVLQQARESGRHEEEGWRLRKDGSRFWARAVITPILEPVSGELSGYAKVTRDLTERKRMDAWLQYGVESAPIAMLMISARGVVAMVNAETERLFGYGRDEIIGQSIEMLVPPQFREDLRERYGSRRVADLASRAGDLCAQQKDGSHFPVEISFKPVPGDTGMAMLVSVIDLTERKASEEYMRAALSEKEVLLREVYHRVKNNLQVIQSLLSLRSRTLPQGLARDVMQESVQRVRAMSLVHEKLYQTGDLARVMLPDYVNDLVRQLMEGSELGRVRLHQDIVRVEVGLDQAVPLGLLLTELISNCFKHAFPETRSGEVWVAITRNEDDGLHISVRDNGIGLMPGKDPFVSTQSMGLKLVTSLAQQLGGKLGCNNGSGAEFFLDMPLR